jgi:MFS family permease
MGNDGVMVQGLVRRGWRSLAGTPPLSFLSVPQALSAVADAFVTVSLAGSLFFNVSPDASRSQVLLYLTITMVPFAVLAPLVAPAVDHFRRGRRVVGATIFLLRAASCVALALTLYDLRFYVFALALLVLAKASGVIKHALVPGLVDDPSELVAANSRLSKLATIAGGAGAALAGALMALGGSETVLGVAAVFYTGAALAMLRVPHQRPVPAAVPESMEVAELYSPAVVVSSGGFMAIRAAVGFFVFMLAFTLRRDAEPLWVYGAAVLAYGIGSFSGNIVAPALRRRLQEERLMALALIVPAIVTAIAALSVGRMTLVVTAAVIGLAATLGRQAFDSLLQRTAPDARRGRAFARYETRFQLTWVLGGLAATAITFPAQISMALLAAMFVPPIVWYLRSAREALRLHPIMSGSFDVAVTRLAEARLWLDAGQHRLAIIEAAAAADLALAARAVSDGRETRRSLDELRRAATDHGAPVTGDDAARALELAQRLVTADPSGPFS